jgi:hypothetical protein
LAAKSLIQTKDFGSQEASKEEKEDVMNISLQSGVLSSFTAFIAINKELNKPVQGPLAHRVIPRPVMAGSSSMRFYSSFSGMFYANLSLYLLYLRYTVHHLINGKFQNLINLN